MLPGLHLRKKFHASSDPVLPNPLLLLFFRPAPPLSVRLPRSLLPRDAALASCVLSMCRWLLASYDGVCPGPLLLLLRPAPPQSVRLPRSLVPRDAALYPCILRAFQCIDDCLPPPMAFARVRYSGAFAQLRHCLFASLAPSSRTMLPFTLASCALSMCRWLLASSDGVCPGPLLRRLRPAPPLSVRLPRSLVPRDAALYPCILRAFHV